MNGAIIRRATVDDLRAVAEVEAQAFPPDEFDSLEKIAARFSIAPELFYVAEINGRLVGHINGLPISTERLDDRFYTATPPIEQNAKGAALMSLVVEEKYRRRGIAAALMQTVLERAAKNFFVLICKREKIEYYRRFGFEPIGMSRVRLGGEPWHDMIRKLQIEV